jgi:hypothetical protein
MAVGDATDIAARLAALLPAGWFQGDTPVLDALLAGIADPLSFLYSLIAYARTQTRIATASDGFLDLISADFFGTGLPRNPAEGDGAFRARILARLLRQQATRAGMIQTLATLTGRVPAIFEPERPADTGAWNSAQSLAYGMAGGWGSRLLPAQCFVTAFRPATSGVPNVAGYGQPVGAYATPSQIQYATAAMIEGAVTDADIYAAIADSQAAGTIAWTRISS